MLKAKSSSGPPLDRFSVPLLFSSVLLCDVRCNGSSDFFIALGISVSVPCRENASVLSAWLSRFGVRSKKPPIVNLLSDKSKSTSEAPIEAPDSSMAMILLLLAEPGRSRALVGVARLLPLSGPPAAASIYARAPPGFSCAVLESGGFSRLTLGIFRVAEGCYYGFYCSLLRPDDSLFSSLSLDC